MSEREIRLTPRTWGSRVRYWPKFAGQHYKIWRQYYSIPLSSYLAIRQSLWLLRRNVVLKEPQP